MVGDLLLEIGTEEIPSGYLENALAALRERAGEALREARIEVAGDIAAYGTPRRLVLIGKAVAGRQEDLVQEIMGPPKSAAFDPEGKPTSAALGFARKLGLGPGDLGLTETPKGAYVCVKRTIAGRPTLDVLPEVLPRLIAQIPWPKSMRWGTEAFSFVRPIHWILALYAGQVVPFSLASVQSGNRTRGHRFMAPEEREVQDVAHYLRVMEEVHVSVDPAEREARVWEIACRAAARVNGRPGEDPDLVRTVSNLTEFPSAVVGGFDPAFLEIPDVVLITAMKEHQRYFSVVDGEGRLLPHFVAVNNTLTRDETVVRRGHERVLRARLSDARFFFEEDRKRPLLDRLKDLEGVLYQADLGTSFAKVQRFKGLALHLAEKVGFRDTEAVGRVADLCKCDLVTHMVGEFPSLQGAMGREYARGEGFAEEICRAVYEHYLPLKAGGELPSSALGAIVGLADRMDTILGCFAVGLEPTGSTDPFGLRRHSLAMIRILEDRAWEVSIPEILEPAAEILLERLAFPREEVCAKVLAFFRERLRQLLLREGYAVGIVEAVLGGVSAPIPDLRKKTEALKRFSEGFVAFQGLVLTVKRITNILKDREPADRVDPGRFEDASETALWDLFQGLEREIAQGLSEGRYEEAMTLMARLGDPVDLFFTRVEVLAKDEALRKNRLALLLALSGPFHRIADFSRFTA